MPHSRRDSLISNWVRLSEGRLRRTQSAIASGGKGERPLTGRMGIKQLMKMIGDNAPDAVKVGRHHLPKCEGTRGSRGVGILGNNLGWVSRCQTRRREFRHLRRGGGMHEDAAQGGCPRLPKIHGLLPGSSLLRRLLSDGRGSSA